MKAAAGGWSESKRCHEAVTRPALLVQGLLWWVELKPCDEVQVVIQTLGKKGCWVVRLCWVVLVVWWEEWVEAAAAAHGLMCPAQRPRLACFLSASLRIFG